MKAQEWPAVRRVAIYVCQDCLDGVAGECHTPGCIQWLRGEIAGQLGERLDLEHQYELLPAQPAPPAQDGAQVEGLHDEACRIFSRNNLNPLGTLGVPGVAAALVEISDLLATATREAYERGQRDEHDVTYKMLSAAYASGRISQEALSYLHYLGEARLDQLKKKRLAERGNNGRSGKS